MLESFEELKGQTLKGVHATKDEVVFELENGDKYKLYHDQDCCESVYVEDIIGDLQGLVGEPVLLAEEATNRNETPEGVPAPEYQDDSFTWTFYKLATNKGYATIRFYGSSNGYYSEWVSWRKI